MFENDSCFELRYSGASFRRSRARTGTAGSILLEDFPRYWAIRFVLAILSFPRPCWTLSWSELPCVATPPVQIQDALADFVETHEFAMHARIVRGVYAKRLEIVKKRLQRASAAAFRHSEPLGGLYLVVYLDTPFRRSDDQRSGATVEGMPVRPLSRYYLAKTSTMAGLFWLWFRMPSGPFHR